MRCTVHGRQPQGLFEATHSRSDAVVLWMLYTVSKMLGTTHAKSYALMAAGTVRTVTPPLSRAALHFSDKWNINEETYGIFNECLPLELVQWESGWGSAINGISIDAIDIWKITMVIMIERDGGGKRPSQDY
ncbi:uncharacterized protein LOC111267475 isoform X2 [Varroa jacobsoni]|uniref:uncharacterized protein LOC111267475 isoform X2 n=1 Tax=Varroa jacobsoni TaxID=62625 RepID=UPI000BF5E153|nr:uncharacterized protein LOC111267475 isoform X2 [Varroa jacobsoni]